MYFHFTSLISILHNISYSLLEHTIAGAQANQFLREIVPNKYDSWNETVTARVCASVWLGDVLCAHVANEA